MPETGTFSIAAQVAWLNVGYEVISDAFILPLAYILGRVSSNTSRFNERFSGAFLALIVVYSICTSFVLLYAPELVVAMKQQQALYEKTVEYIRLEAIAIFISSCYGLISLALVLYNRHKALYLLLLIQTLFTIACDTVFVSQYSFSIKLGVNGMAITNIIVSLAMMVIGYNALSKSGIRLSLRDLDFGKLNWFREWFKVGTKSGLESLVRNIAFIIMILQMINELNHAGTFWIANGFIWGWLLLPVLS
nr:hypothetical protein [Parashewanella tropica]